MWLCTPIDDYVNGYDSLSYKKSYWVAWLLYFILAHSRSPTFPYYSTIYHPSIMEEVQKHCHPYIPYFFLLLVIHRQATLHIHKWSYNQTATFDIEEELWFHEKCLLSLLREPFLSPESSRVPLLSKVNESVATYYFAMFLPSAALFLHLVGFHKTTPYDSIEQCAKHDPVRFIIFNWRKNYILHTLS